MFLASGDLIINNRNNDEFLLIDDGKKWPTLGVDPKLLTLNFTIDIILMLTKIIYLEKIDFILHYLTLLLA